MPCSIIQVSILSNVGYFQYYPSGPMEVRLVVQLLLTYHIYLFLYSMEPSCIPTRTFFCVESDTLFLNFRFLGLDRSTCF